MSRSATVLRRALIRLSYFLPLISLVALGIYAAQPHLWFVYDHTAHSTMSLWDLQADAWELCKATLEASDGSVNTSFAYAVTVLSVIFWIVLVLYGLCALASAACSVIAFALPPTHRYANRAKRVFRTVCPNRICFVLTGILLFPWALFPQLMVLCYRYFLGISTRVHADPFHIWIALLVLAFLCAALFLLTLPWQAQEHMDMFRIYKSANTVPKKGDETL